MPEKNESNQTKMFKLLFLISGIRIKQNSKIEINLPYIFTICLTWVITYILVVLNFIYSHSGYTMDDLVDALFDIFIGMAVITYVSISVYQRHNFFYIYNTMEEGLYKYEILVIDAHTIRNKYIRRSTKIVYSSAISLAIAAMPKFINPLFFGIVHLTNSEGDSNSLPLPLSCWIPFSMNTIPKYLFAYSLGFVTSAVSALVCLTVFSLEYLTITNALCEIEILSQSIRRMEETAVLLAETTPLRPPDMPQVHRCFKILAKQAIKHHQQIIAYIRRINCLLGMLLLVVVNVAAGLVTVSSYRFSVEPNLISSKTLTYFGLMIGPLLIVWLQCWMGQLVINAGEELRNALHSTNWQDFPSSFTKDLLIMGEMLNRPLCLKLAGIYVLDLETFTSVLQATYSYFNVLRSLRFPDSS